MPVKVVFKSAMDSNIFVYAHPDMVQKWRNDHSVPLEDVLSGKCYSYMNYLLFIYFFKKKNKEPAIHISQGDEEPGRRALPHDPHLLETFNNVNSGQIIQKILEDGEIMEVGNE